MCAITKKKGIDEIKIINPKNNPILEASDWDLVTSKIPYIIILIPRPQIPTINTVDR